MAILYDARWVGKFGIGRFADEILKSVPGLEPFRVSRRPWNPLDCLLLGATLRAKQPTLYFSPGYNAPVGSHCPFIFTLHDLHHLKVPADSGAVKRLYYQSVLRPACQRAKLVLTVSEYSKAEILEWSKVDADRLINVGNGVGSPFCSFGRRYSPGYPYLLYVGSHKPHKNLGRLIDAFSASGLGSQIRLLLAGPRDPELREMLEAKGASRAVGFVGSPGSQELAELYRGAEAFVFPSLYEGFGLPPLEAMACGTPVLTSNVCALPEVAGDAAIFVDPLNTDSIADGLKQLVFDSALRMRLRKSGLRRARQFTWSTVAAKTLRALEMALNN